jgi:hypothetical protein
MTQVPLFENFPTGVMSGSYDRTFDLSSLSFYNPAFVTAQGGTSDAARSAFLASLEGGKAYFNLHSSEFPGGEIRGFFQAPDGGATLALLSLGLAGMGGVRRWLRSRS